MSNADRRNILTTTFVLHRLSTWIKTMRLQTALVTSITLIAGYITVSPLTLRSTAVLTITGLFFHIFAFTLNEVEDLEYDSEIDNGSYHPIAEGEVDSELARFIAWSAYLVSVAVPIIAGYKKEVAGLIIVAGIPTYFYNRYSKMHWWSNGYVSVWASLMVFAGAMSAGTPNILTVGVALILSMQAFVQSVQGGLKDITGHENSFCKLMGVRLMSAKEYMNENMELNLSESIMDVEDVDVLVYTKKFLASVYTMKITQVVVLILISYQYLDLSIWYMRAFLLVYFIGVVVFFTSLSILTVYIYDRERIKRAASIHEITSIVLLGLTLATLDPHGGVFVAIAPILWYLIVNVSVHSSTLAPDV